MISILLATYNGERYINQSIDSIVNQSFKDWKLLIGFNGTTDSSRQIVESYNDSRISIHDYEDDKGKAKTLNKLLKHVDTPWCAIQDDDDVWHPQKLEIQIKFTDKYDVIGSFIKYINENNDIIGSPRLTEKDAQIRQFSMKGINQIANSSAIFKTELARKTGGWSEDTEGIEDFDFWLKIMKTSSAKFVNVPEVLCLHRINKNSNFNTKEQDINKII